MYANENAYDELFWAAAQQQAARTAVVGIDAPTLFALAKAHAGVESGFSPTAYHWDGPDAVRNVSRGLLQIEGATALAAGLPVGDDTDTFTGPAAPRDWGSSTVLNRTTGMYDPEIAIPFGLNIIATNLVATGGNVDVAIAAYNEGLGRARADTDGDFRDQAYVDAVNRAFAYFQGQGTTASGPSAPQDGGSGLTPGQKALGLAVLSGLLTWALKHFWGGGSA